MDKEVIALRNPTTRNTQLRQLTIKGVGTFTFSYDTCVAFSGPVDGKNHLCVRLRNRWRSTTGRHFVEAGIDSYVAVDDDTFEDILIAALSGWLGGASIIRAAAEAAIPEEIRRVFYVELLRQIHAAQVSLQVLERFALKIGMTESEEEARAWIWALEQSGGSAGNGDKLTVLR